MRLADMTHLRIGVWGSALVGILVGAVAGLSAQWPQFRGPNGSGVDSATGYPVSFSPTANMVWKAAIPYGQSSPVVVGDRVYLTASDGDNLQTYAFDAGTGRQLWRRELPRTHVHKTYRANDPASPTAAADQDGVVVFFADFGLAAYTRDGKDRWTVPLGPFKSFYGMAASPILAGDLVVLLCDQQSGSYVIALDRQTGQIRWRKDRAGVPDGWATPMIFRPATAAPAQIITLGSTRLDSYALETGEPLWWMPIGTSGAMGTPLSSGDTLFVVTSGSNEPGLPTFESTLEKLDANKDGRLAHQEFLADKDMGEHFGWIDTDGDEFITATEWNTTRNLGLGEFGAIALRPAAARGRVEPATVLWRFQKNLPYMPAPLLYRDVLYLVKAGGIVTSLDPQTGQTFKTGRAPGAIGAYLASPVAADGKVYVANEEGKITVLKAGPQWEVLGVNDVGDEIHATPALSGGRLYVRTRNSVYCFGAK
jgi:outer membrane protein assembly factor BamB